VNTADAFHCRADDFETSAVACFKQHGLSYAYNEMLGDKPLTQNPGYEFHKTSASVPILWDADFFHGGHPPTSWNSMAGAELKWNYLYADGHVAEFEESPSTAFIIPR
jgi:hypothetical protein